MTDAILFPGQGSEAPGMGGAALTREGPVRRLLQRASAAVGLDLVEVIQRGAPALAQTEFGQPALLAVSIGLGLELQASGVKPEALAGHSVGELAALTLAGCLEPEEAIDCVIERSRLMAEAARATPGGMLALRVESEAEAMRALKLGAEAGLVELAARNSPSEWVLTGTKPALAAVAAKFQSVPLAVAGPWHSQLMAPAQEVWGRSLAKLSWRRPQIPVVSNTTGKWLEPGADLAELLAGQLTRPVQWSQTLQTMKEAGVTAWHCVGPGRVLRGLCRKNLGTEVAVFLHDGAQPA